MDTNERALGAIVNGIDMSIKFHLGKAHFDVTRIGVVKALLPDNKYTVSIIGTEYSVPCSINVEFNVGDRVLVLCVQNDYDRMYIVGRG